MTLRACVACCALAVALTTAGPAWSQSGRAGPRGAAKEHLERGLRLYGNAEYPAAIEEFKAGYQLEPHPDFLYAMGQAQRLAGQCRDAVKSYRAFLATNPPESEAELGRENLESCDEELAREPPAPPKPRASAHAPRAQPTAPSPPVAPADARPFYTDWLGDTLAGLGIAGIGVGTGVWIAAAGNASSANDAHKYGDFVADGESADRLQPIALVVGGVGVALLAAGIIRFATRPGAPSSPRGASAR